MGLHNYISETEAAARAGVSPKTLKRFAEAGYLQVEIEPDGLRLYCPAQLDEIFTSNQGPILPEGDETHEVRAEENPLDTARENSLDTARESSGEDVRASEAPPLTAETPPNVEKANEAPEASTTCEAEPIVEANSDSLASDSDELRRELARLKNLLKNRDDLLSLKEAEVNDLKGQRDWLKTRVERLEEKGDRDQILLLSETQTIRKLIAIQDKKRTPVRNFFEWLGLVPPAPVSVPVINTRPAANADKPGTSDVPSLSSEKAA